MDQDELLRLCKTLVALNDHPEPGLTMYESAANFASTAMELRDLLNEDARAAIAADPLSLLRGHLPEHACPCCTCGTDTLRWSDREAIVFPDDHERVADVVVNCALDHSYDRLDGVPRGLDLGLTERLRPIVERYLSAKRADWRWNTVHLNDDECQRLHADVLAAIKEKQ